MNEFLPASVRLPGGYVVLIKARATSTLKRKLKGGESWGFWDDVNRTIWIDKSASERKQKYTFTHEFDHAFNDWRHQYLGEDIDRKEDYRR